MLDLNSDLQEYSAIEDEWENEVFSFDIRNVEESIDNRDSGSDDNRDTEVWPYVCSFSADAEADQLLKRWGRSWDDVNNKKRLRSGYREHGVENVFICLRSNS